MERNEFAPPAQNGACACDLPPSPRMENGGAAGGCGYESQGPACGGCVGHEGCGDGSWGLCAHPVAMVYAPCQLFRALYDPATALAHGTLFSELDLPLGAASCAFTTDRCACRAERRRS